MIWRAFLKNKEMRGSSENLKPWLKTYDYYWYAAGRHAIPNHDKTEGEFPNHVTAFLVVQDCNIAGEYLRMIYWCPDIQYSFFNVIGFEEWPFNVPHSEIKTNDVVLYKDQEYVATRHGEFELALERK